MDHSRGTMDASAASELATDALLFLANDHGRLASFLATTGFAPADLRAQIGSPAFLCGVLEFILGDESLLLAFAGNGGFDPSLVARAHRTLSSGMEPSGAGHA